MKSSSCSPDAASDGVTASRFVHGLLHVTTFVAALAICVGRGDGRRSLAHAQDDPAATVDACVRSGMAGGGIHGAQLAVARDGQVLFERAYGRKHRDRTDPVDIHTQFRIGSTTKAMTALAILQQVDKGVLDLDAPITRYLPGFE